MNVGQRQSPDHNSQHTGGNTQSHPGRQTGVPTLKPANHITNQRDTSSLTGGATS